MKKYRKGFAGFTVVLMAVLAGGFSILSAEAPGILLFGETRNISLAPENDLTIKMPTGILKLTLPEGLRALLCKGEHLYFLRTEKLPPSENEDTREGSEPVKPQLRYVAGVYHLGENRVAVQWPLAGIPPGAELKRLDSSGELLFVHYLEKKNQEEGGGSLRLLRLNTNSGDAGIHHNVTDFVLRGRVPVILECTPDGECRLNINSSMVPLTIRGKLHLERVVDERLLIVGGEEKKEVVDLVSQKNIYLYGKSSVAATPVDGNLLFQVKDVADPVPTGEKHIFYKIFIDGREEGRTETGLASLEKKLKASVDAGRHHIIRLERWELNRKRRQYRRANNIVQPKARRIFIPSNRLLRISVTFDGTQHVIATETVME